MVEVLPGQEIAGAVKQRAAAAVLSCVADDTKEWVKEQAIAVGKSVLSSEVGRNVAVGIVQGKVGANQKIEAASNRIDEVVPECVVDARTTRKEFKSSACEHISKIGNHPSADNTSDILKSNDSS